MDEISLLAQLHDGVFTTAEAEALGVGREALGRAVGAGSLRRLARGLYGTGAAAARPEDRHLELCRALRVAYPDAVLAGRSAVVAVGLPVWGVPLGAALLHRPVERQVRRSGAVIRPGDSVAATIETSVGPATSVAAAVVQVALDHGTLPGVVSADAALHAGTVSADDLLVAVTERSGHRHSQRALAMVRLTDRDSESPGESRTRVALMVAGYDVESQVVVCEADGAFVGRADLRIAGTRVLIEFDGLVKYADDGARALFAEKVREDRLRALGWVVVRVTWDDLAHPDRLLAKVRQALDLAARLPAVG